MIKMNNLRFDHEALIIIFAASKAEKNEFFIQIITQIK